MSYEKLTPVSPEAQSESPVADHVNALASLFPSVVREGKVDFDALRQMLGDDVAKDDELFGLQWKGKAQARRAAITPSLGTLRPCKEESVDWDTTKNLYLEGDNLEVLKLLRKSYASKVKMIYIDPPYNTGKDFVYPDNYQNGIEEYKKLTGQQGRFKANVETSGRYHTDWLNMMYPRLMLAKDFLNDDGVIFISIDDHEIGNLRKIGDEIFGENNFVGCFLWKKKSTSTNVENALVSPQTDYQLCYAKNISPNSLNRRETSTKDRKYPYVDDNGEYRTTVIEKKDSGEYARATMKYPILGVYPREGKRWQIGEETARKYETEGLFFIENSVVKLKIYKHSDKTTFSANPTLLLECGSTDSASKETNLNLFNKAELFSNPKPTKLLKHLIGMGANKDSVILDFFSGSATTAHAVMQLNAEDGGCRKFIMIQLPEPCSEGSEAQKEDYKDICEIGKERIRRAGKKIKEDAGLQGLDIGFRVYKLDSSNLRVWNPEVDNLELALGSHEKHLLPGRTQEDLLYEILLKQGIELTEDARIREFEGKRVYSLGHGQYYACMETVISSEQIESLALGIAQWKNEESPDNTQCAVFVIDEAFRTDTDKLNFSKILEQHGIPFVKAL